MFTFTLTAGMLLNSAGVAQSVPPLINYQGQLASPSGSPLATADYVLSFSIYDSATNANTPVWGPQVFDAQAGQGHGATVPVVRGYFNVILGPWDINGISLANVFNATNRYVQISVGTNQPILPRQQILSTPFAFQAANSAALAGTNWAALFGTNDPVNGQLPGSRIAPGTITAQQIGPSTITANQIAPGTLTGIQIANAAIGFTNLAIRQVGTNVGVGGLAISPSSGDFQTTSSTDVNVPNLQVTLMTSGGPVEVFTTGMGAGTNSFLEIDSSAYSGGTFSLYRDGTKVQGELFDLQCVNPSTPTAGDIPSCSIRFIDFPPAGSHTYSMYIRSGNPGYARTLNIRLAAREF
jgi:hypothetical protein